MVGILVSFWDGLFSGGNVRFREVRWRSPLFGRFFLRRRVTAWMNMPSLSQGFSCKIQTFLAWVVFIWALSRSCGLLKNEGIYKSARLWPKNSERVDSIGNPLMSLFGFPWWHRATSRETSSKQGHPTRNALKVKSSELWRLQSSSPAYFASNPFPPPKNDTFHGWNLLHPIIYVLLYNRGVSQIAAINSTAWIQRNLQGTSFFKAKCASRNCCYFKKHSLHSIEKASWLKTSQTGCG